jgi:hypothetical protein
MSGILVMIGMHISWSSQQEKTLEDGCVVRGGKGDIHTSILIGVLRSWVDVLSPKELAIADKIPICIFGLEI